MVWAMHRSSASAVPEGPLDGRPPVVIQPPSGTAGTGPGARPRIRPTVWTAPATGPAFSVDHPYVRRFWVPILGPGAIADLLRLATAAARHRSLPLPRHLSTLARAGMVSLGADGAVAVRTVIPPVPPPLRRRLPHHLRREHLIWLGRFEESSSNAGRP